MKTLSASLYRLKRFIFDILYHAQVEKSIGSGLKNSTKIGSKSIGRLTIYAVMNGIVDIKELQFPSEYKVNSNHFRLHPILILQKVQDAKMGNDNYLFSCYKKKRNYIHQCCSIIIMSLPDTQRVAKVILHSIDVLRCNLREDPHRLAVQVGG